MTSRWLRLLEEKIGELETNRIDDMAFGRAPDYVTYRHWTGYIEALRDVMNIAAEIDSRIQKGD